MTSRRGRGTAEATEAQALEPAAEDVVAEL
jgi:hypothetical protein